MICLIFPMTLYTDFDALTLAVKLSMPDALSIQIRRFYQSVTNSLIFEVCRLILLNPTLCHSVCTVLGILGRVTTPQQAV